VLRYVLYSKVIAVVIKYIKLFHGVLCVRGII